MSNYPSTVYAPRTKQNKSGVVYAPLIPTTLFAEDITKLDDEVVAIETDLESKINQAVKSDSSPQFNLLELNQLDIGEEFDTLSVFIREYLLNLGDPKIDPISVKLATISPESEILGKTLAILGGLVLIGENGDVMPLSFVSLDTDTHEFKNYEVGIDPSGDFLYIMGAVKMLFEGTYYPIDALSYSVAGTPPVTDGTYTIGARLTPSGTDGTITVQGGIITSIQEAT